MTEVEGPRSRSLLVEVQCACAVEPGTTSRRRVLAGGTAYPAALRGPVTDDVKQAIADKLIALAKTGERNPDVLCEKVLRDIRGQQGHRANDG